MKMGLLAAGLIAATSLSCAQSVDPSATRVSACELPNPKKTISEWSNFSRYQKDNAMLESPAPSQKRVVFSAPQASIIGAADSIRRSSLESYISTAGFPEMVLRFQRDVVALKPAAVVFLGGTNDIAGNTGPMTLDMTEDNIRTMASIAEANGIKMILASQLPVTVFPWRRCMHPAADLLALTVWEKNFAAEHHLGFVDFYAALAGSDGTFRPGLSSDGAHPDKQAYEIMAPIVEREISSVLSDR